MAFDPFAEDLGAEAAPAPQQSGPSDLSSLLEKIEAKFPEDEDVVAFSDAFNAEYGDEDEEFADSDDLGEMGDEGAEGGPADFEAMFAEDTGEEEDEFEMPAPKKKPGKL